MQWAEHIAGKRGTIVHAKDLKIGDTIVLLERQIDLGNAIPVVLTSVSRVGSTLITMEGNPTLQHRVWYHRCNENTLIFLLDA